MLSPVIAEYEERISSIIALGLRILYTGLWDPEGSISLPICSHLICWSLFTTYCAHSVVFLGGCENMTGGGRKKLSCEMIRGGVNIWGCKEMGEIVGICAVFRRLVGRSSGEEYWSIGSSRGRLLFTSFDRISIPEVVAGLTSEQVGSLSVSGVTTTQKHRPWWRIDTSLMRTLSSVLPVAPMYIQLSRVTSRISCFTTLSPPKYCSRILIGIDLLVIFSLFSPTRPTTISMHFCLPPWSLNHTPGISSILFITSL
mmetsp:Transcript_22076/g.32173  ORF Transcript_22076/g.32173 Transcript_22076/m.32173 type:complete len:256 (+) Transcript_22076:416-1183(+)